MHTKYKIGALNFKFYIPSDFILVNVKISCSLHFILVCVLFFYIIPKHMVCLVPRFPDSTIYPLDWVFPRKMVKKNNNAKHTKSYTQLHAD